VKLSKIHFWFCQLPPPKFESALCFGFLGQIRVALAGMQSGDSLMMPKEPKNRAYNAARKIGVRFTTRKENGIGWKITKL
jgi:hypothetical protein